MNNLKNKLLGTVTLDGDTSTPKPNAMIIGLMKSFGLSPELIQQYADSVKNAVVDKLTSIDDKLALIASKLDTLEMKLAELEVNQRVLLDAAKDPNAEQFEQMAEQPLSVAITG